MSLYVFEYLVQAPSRTLGSTGADAWDGVYAKAKSKNFDTSKQSIDDYAGVASSIAAGAACAATPGAQLATPLCAAIGGIIGSMVADLIQSIGGALFGGSGPEVWIDAYWNPIADKAVAGIVRALRAKQGKDVDSPPGGSFRNYPEWNAVAVAWAQNVNAVLIAQGSPIPKWYSDSPGDKVPGRVTDLALGVWYQCMKAQNPLFYGQWQGGALPPVPPQSDFCQKMLDIGSGNSVMPQAIVQATQQTTEDVLSGVGRFRVNGGSGSSSSIVTPTTVVVGGALAWLVWKFLL